MPYIIQLDNAPIPKDDHLSEYELYDEGHDFIDTVYTENEIGAKVIAAFIAILEGSNGERKHLIKTEIDEGGRLVSFTLQVGFHMHYFSPVYDSFVEKLEQLHQSCSLYDLVQGDLYTAAFQMIRTIHDEYGDYVHSDGECRTLDDFLRYAEADTTYYVGAIFFYK